MYILDPLTFKTALESKGIKSILELSKRLNIHRNTIQYYLGGASVLNEKLEIMLQALDLDPKTAFRKVEQKISKERLELVKFADELATGTKIPLAIVLFGSRARGTAHKYSDFDIGVYSKEGFSHKDFLKLFKVKDEFEESSPYLVDLVNLNAVESDFLDRISGDWEFLAGSGESFVMLKNQVSLS